MKMSDNRNNMLRPASNVSVLPTHTKVRCVGNTEQLVHSSKLEWPGYQPPPPGVVPCYPMLIVELHRLMPYVDHFTKYIDFHPINMPDVTVKRITIVGTVLRCYEEMYFSKYIVDDGTGAILVVHSREHKQYDRSSRSKVDEKHKTLADSAARNKTWLLPDSASKKSSIRIPVKTPFEYAADMPEEFKNYMKLQWWKATNEGMLGKDVELLDYVHVFGHCTLDMGQHKMKEKHLTTDDVGVGKLIVYARGVRPLTEEVYNKTTLQTINDFARKRYQVANKVTDGQHSSTGDTSKRKR